MCGWWCLVDNNTLEYTDINIPAAADRCSDTALTYLTLVFKAVCDFTDEDRADWLTATGRTMPRLYATPLTVKWGVLP